jgi:glycosyltransferase involved in cell wall biosynthesis
MRIYWDPYGLSRSNSGIARYGDKLHQHLSLEGVVPEVLSYPLNASRSGLFVQKLLASKVSWPYTSSHLLSKIPLQSIFHGLCNFNLPLKRRAPTKFVLTVHDLIPLTVAPWSIQSLQLRWLLPRALRNADRVIAVSAWTARQIIQRFPEHERKISIVRNGVPELRPDPAATQQSRSQAMLLYVARYEPYKRLEFVVNLMDYLPKDYRLHIVTDDLGRRHLADLVKKSNRIDVSTNLAEASLQDLYQKASCYLHPSLYEGYCFPVVEALSHRCPVVATAGSAMDETIHDGVTGRLMLPSAPLNDWASVIRSFVESPSVIPWAVEYSLLPSWNIAAKAVKSIYQELLADP